MEEVIDKIWTGQNSLVNIVFAIKFTRKRMNPNGKKIKGNEKIKSVTENWPRNYIWLMGFMMKIIFNKIWPHLLKFPLKHKQYPNICWFKRVYPDDRVTCQRSYLLLSLLRWHSCWDGPEVHVHLSSVSHGATWTWRSWL